MAPSIIDGASSSSSAAAAASSDDDFFNKDVVQTRRRSSTVRSGPGPSGVASMQKSEKSQRSFTTSRDLATNKSAAASALAAAEADAERSSLVAGLPDPNSPEFLQAPAASVPGAAAPAATPKTARHVSTLSTIVEKDGKAKEQKRAHTKSDVGNSPRVSIVPKEIADLRYQDSKRADQYYKLNKLIDIYMAEGDLANARTQMKELSAMYSVDKQAEDQKDIPYIKKALNTNDIDRFIKEKKAKLEEYKQAVLKASSAIAQFNTEFERYDREVSTAVQLLVKELNNKDKHYILTILAVQAFALEQSWKRLRDLVDYSNLEPRIRAVALHEWGIVWRDVKPKFDKQIFDLLERWRSLLHEYGELFGLMVTAINDGDFKMAEKIYRSIGMKFGVRSLTMNKESDIPDVKKVIEIDAAIKKYVSELADYKKQVEEKREAIEKFKKDFKELDEKLKVAIANFTASINSKEKHPVKTIVDSFMKITNAWDEFKQSVNSDGLGLTFKRVALKELDVVWVSFQEAVVLQMSTLDKQLRAYVRTKVTKSDLDESLSRVDKLLSVIEKDIKNNGFFKVIASLQGILPDYVMLKLATEIEEDDAEERKSVVIKKDDEILAVPKLNWVFSSLLKKLDSVEVQKEFDQENINKWRAQILKLREFIRD